MRNLQIIVSTGAIKFDFVSQLVSGKQILPSDSHTVKGTTHFVEFKINDSQWKELSKFAEGKVRFLVRSEIPIEFQKNPAKPGSSDNFYMKCAGGFLVNWEAAARQVKAFKQVSSGQQTGNAKAQTQAQQPIRGMLSQFLPLKLQKSMDVSIGADSRLGSEFSPQFSIMKSLDVINKKNESGINDLCELIPALHSHFGGKPLKDAEAKDLVEVLGGQMIFPQQSEQGVPVWDVSGSHAQMEAIKQVAAGSRDMQWMALKTWLRAYGMGKKSGQTNEAVRNALRMLSTKCEYTFDPAWCVDPATNEVTVAATHGENFDFYGASATPPEVIQEQIGVLTKLQQKMLKEKGAQKQVTLQQHNAVMNRLYSTGEDCEDIANYISIVSAVMNQDSNLSGKEFQKKYMYFSKIMSDDADTFRLYLEKLHAFIKKAWDPKFAMKTCLVLAGAPNMNAGAAGSGKNAVQKTYEPSDTIHQIQEESAFQMVAGHAVAAEDAVPAGEKVIMKKVVNGSTFSVSHLPGLSAEQMCEGTATTFESGNTKRQAKFDMQVADNAPLTDKAKTAMSKLTGKCTAMDADNRVAALLVKDMKVAPDMSSGIGQSLSVKAAVSYGNKEDNFYKYLLSAGAHQIFHVQTGKKTDKPVAQAQESTGEATIVFQDDEGGDVCSIKGHGLEHILEIQDAIDKSYIASGIRFQELVNGRANTIAVQREIGKEEKKACASLALFNAFENNAPLSMENLDAYVKLGIRHPPLSLGENTSITDNHNLILMRGCLTDMNAAIATGKSKASEAWAAEHAARLKYVKQYLDSRCSVSKVNTNALQVHTISESLWGWKIPQNMDDFQISAKVFS